MEKAKYVFTEETIVHWGHILHRIKSAKDFGDVKVGDLGGFIEKKTNLSSCGNAWVYGNAQVYGDARVCDNAQVRDNAWVYGDTRVRGNAQVCGDVHVYGNAHVYGDAMIRSAADYFCIKGAGSFYRNTTFFKTIDDAVYITCGCFTGTISEFAERVHETHGGTKYEREYLAAVELVRIHFDIAD